MSFHLTRRRALLLGGTGVLVAGGTAAGIVALTGREVTADIVVFGATPAGIIAAVQARRMGRRAVIVEPGSHVGGMITGGLGNSDLGAKESIGGLAAEFFRRVYAKYTSTKHTADSPMRYTFEPHVAREVMDDLLDEADIPVYTGLRLRRAVRSGSRITALEADNGQTFTGRVFIDASYEGDLMAEARVDWLVGRESNGTFGEAYNGVHLSVERQHTLFVSPYRTEGVTASGLLPGIIASIGPNGSADDTIQAYNYRMCLTKSPDRIPFPKPEGYDSADYELLRRLVRSGYTGDFFRAFEVGRQKFDVNTSGPFSTDFIGANHSYPTASAAERAAIVAEHLRFQQGLMWCLANDPGLPPWVREQTQQWGLDPGEFTETGGWPPQLYVREARRMRSAYIMTEHDCFGTTKAPDSVGLASYFVDSHNCNRVVHTEGVLNEGSVAVPVAGPFPVSYRSIVPIASQCTNLFVPVCLAATHTAYGSIRMEPVFMILGQSSATAAVMAIESDQDVQAVDYGRLTARLRADGQVLAWPADAADVILDNGGPGVSRVGKWASSKSVGGYYGYDYEHDANAPKGTTSISFVPKLPAQGMYTVYLRWTAKADRAGNVPVDILHSSGTTTVTIDQRSSGGVWVSVGSFRFAATGKEKVTIRTDGTDGVVVADAVRFAPD
ncbi:MAG: FAD-dependent oxidoreductase [Hamadaea sp.]|uniref:FAD-dependent oxidoreductase n=1 Tax=Hamadaea sp. TaxID=2024425 RepID=UPI00179B0726|nr:FAD-dependent oxidoreductase [Hamadaea sp.]NUT22834.1 FAD-dependent oxidoreductase [Hamadaea sp.]